MKKCFAALIASAALASVVALAGCGGSAQAPADASAATSAAPAAAAATAETSAAPAAAAAGELAPGEYLVEFTTDSSMFHLNETCDGKAVLTVGSDGQMSIHVPLVSKRIVNLYLGTAADAEADEANWLKPMAEEVTYDDGYTEEVNAFDIVVPALGEKFDVAILGEKGNWYDHKVSVRNPEPIKG